MKPSDIMHPEDAKAISVLKKIPLIDSICREVLEFAEENIYRGENLAMMMRVTPTCMPDLFSDMSVVVSKVGIEMPDLYVYNDPVMNAFTFGETKPFVCVSSSVVEKMTREEVKAILAHECGHILCQHVLYNSVVHTLEDLGHDLGAIHYSLTGPMYLALCYWSRRSEFSADRCAAADRSLRQKASPPLLRVAPAGRNPSPPRTEASSIRQTGCACVRTCSRHRT